MRFHPTRKQRRLLAVFLALTMLNLVVPGHAEAATPTPIGQFIGPVPRLAQLPVSADVPLPPAPSVTKRFRASVSAYSSTKDQTDGSPFTTASGTTVHEGTIAMNGVRFGTKVRIPDHFGDRVFVVEDRMSARYGRNHTDIWMPSRAEALKWGRRTVTVEILQ